MNFSRKVKCVDSTNQPRLCVGATYNVVCEVNDGIAQRGGEDKPAKGFIVMEEGESNALPYVYNRSRFAELVEVEQA